MKEKAEIAVQVKATDLLQVIAQAVANPLCDVEKMRALFELQKDIRAEEHRIVFESAMTRMQARIPQMDKLGKGKNSKFSRFDDIHAVMKPLLHEFGFNVSFSEESHTEKTTTFTMKIAHEDGHSETIRRTLSNDTASKNSAGVGIRPAIQDDGSTTSYARRYMYKMRFDIADKGEDTNGESAKIITLDQATYIRDLIAQTKSNESHFLKLMITNAEGVDSILLRDYDRIVFALETKLGSKK